MMIFFTAIEDNLNIGAALIMMSSLAGIHCS
jgi:hypothetical protein